ncbi:MAG: bacillithiol biosynthesis cysteine-adding enzyme BshC [Bacteroidetes bacterium]|jgi:bacillithiol biosynthesis cysteine-adding enzyme BshC|nr:bacillithiol biosynthesis cysteine-adding enzyme BshC [Bacteroidota bacterium]
MPTTTALDLRPVPFADLPGFPDLFTTYCTDYARVADYYAADWRSPDDRRAAADRAAHHPRNRARLAEILHEQNARWGMDEATSAHIEALRGEETVAVVTGQQVGLLGGPLYTIFKTLTALRLTRQLAEEMDRPVVPVFWLEGGDHDLEEVARTHLLRRNEVVPIRYTGHTLPEDGNLGPVGRLVFNDHIGDIIDRVEATLPPSDFHDAVIALLRETYRPGATLLDAFARLLRRLVPDAGLVFIDPDDVRLKQLSAPLFRREIEDHATSYDRLTATSERLAGDFHAQVRPRSTNLFLVTDDGRYALDAEGDDRFRLHGRDEHYSRDDLLALLADAPERFSPNVVLRPLMQDHLLPTAAYVAGPSEVSYFAQYKALYDWADVPMPVIYPRASLSLVESKVQKVLDKFDLEVSDCAEDADRLFQRVVKAQMSVDVDAVFDEAASHFHRAVNDVKAPVGEVDRSLIPAVEATRAAFINAWDDLKTNVLRAEKRQQDELRDQLDKARANLYPEGTLQERVISVFYFLNKYSLHLLPSLQETLSLDTSAHQVVQV